MMKKFKNLVFLLMLACCISFVSCGDDDSDPDTYITFEGVDGSASGKFTGGMTPQSKVPLASYRLAGGGRTYCMAFKTTISLTDFEASSGRSDFDNIYIYFIGKAAGTTYDGTNASVGLRITGQNSDNVFYLIDPSITITKYSGYIEGSYEGEYPSSSGNIVKGSFVVKNFGDDKWPIPW